MMTDPIADFFIRIKNGYLARKNIILVPHSKMKEELAKFLTKEGYVGKLEVKKITKAKKQILITLLYQGTKPKLTDIEIVSKLSKRIWVEKRNIPKVLGGLGIAVLSTPLGILSDREARKKGVGGEIICKIW